MSQPSTIFISYTRSDEAFALDLYRALTQAGLNAWIDQHGLMKGRPWDQSVERSLKESGRVVVVLSPRAVASGPVLDEISCAVDNGKQIFPVLLQVCQLPLRINRLDYFDLARGKATIADVVTALRAAAVLAGEEVPLPGSEGTLDISGKPGQDVGGGRRPRPARRRRVAVLMSLLVLALGALAVLTIAKVRFTGFCANTAWQAQDYTSPLLARCGSCQPCLDRRSRASLLLGTDWKRVAWNNPLLADCMSLPQCSERRAQAYNLRRADWRHVRFDAPLLKDCMGYPACEDRSRHAASLTSIRTWDRAVVRSLHDDCMFYRPCLDAASQRTPPPPSPPLDFTKYQCCDDAGALDEKCRQWKRARHRIASDCAGL